MPTEPWKEVLDVAVTPEGEAAYLEFEQADGSCRTTFKVRLTPLLVWKLLTKLLLFTQRL